MIAKLIAEQQDEQYQFGAVYKVRAKQLKNK
jgi:hypothetical protein